MTYIHAINMHIADTHTYSRRLPTPLPPLYVVLRARVQILCTGVYVCVCVHMVLSAITLSECITY